MKLKEFLKDFTKDSDNNPNDFLIISDKPYIEHHIFNSLAFGRENGKLLKKGLTEEILNYKYISLTLLSTLSDDANFWYIEVKKEE